MNKDDVVQKLLTDAINGEGACQFCLTCTHSYFRKGSYDGFCKYVESHRDFTYMHLKSVDVYDVCEHWESKPKKKT